MEDQKKKKTRQCNYTATRIVAVKKIDSPKGKDVEQLDCHVLWAGVYHGTITLEKFVT